MAGGPRLTGSEETTYEGELHMQNQAGLRVDMEMLYNSDDSFEAGHDQERPVLR